MKQIGIKRITSVTTSFFLRNPKKCPFMSCTSTAKFMSPSTALLLNYVQGQSPEDDLKSREYFYFIDHQGMLFLDDARMKNFTSNFKDKSFLRFFFSRLKFNNLKRYQEFPFLSLCGKERNFVRCDDLPIVFTHLIECEGSTVLSYAHAGDKLVVPFEPEKLCMQIESGRVYHPGPVKTGGVGLVRSKLAIQLAGFFSFEDGEGNPPTHITWKNNVIPLNQELVQVIESLKEVRKYSSGVNL